MDKKWYRLGIVCSEAVHTIGPKIGINITKEIELYNSKYNVIRIKHIAIIDVLTSFYAEAKEQLDLAVTCLALEGCPVIKSRITSEQCPKEIDPLFMEVNFPVSKLNTIYPVFKRRQYMDYTGLARQHNSDDFSDFVLAWSGIQGSFLGYCLFDSFPEEDLDWRKSWSLSE